MATAGKVSLRLKPPVEAFGHALSEGSKPQLHQAALSVAAGLPANLAVNINVTNNRKGRAIAILTVAHPGALAMQIKNGLITGAAANVGLEVKRYRV